MKRKYVLTVVLAVTMLLGTIPMPALAADTAGPAAEVTTEEAAAAAEEEAVPAVTEEEVSEEPDEGKPAEEITMEQTPDSSAEETASEEASDAEDPETTESETIVASTEEYAEEEGIERKYAKLSDAVNWMNNYLGKSIDFDGSYGAQCVDVFNKYLKDVFGISNPIGMYPVGYAYQIFDYNAPSGFTKISGSSSFQVGDIVIWNRGNGSTTGHVGIVYSTNNGTVQIFQQRYNGETTCQVHPVNSKGTIRGVFRPNFEHENYGPAVSTGQNFAPGKYILVNVGSGYTMNYGLGWQGLAYKPIIMSNTDGTPEQTFDIRYVGAGKYAFYITHPDGGVLNIWRTGTAQAGDALTKWNYSGSDTQLFYITSMGDGTYVLQSASNTGVVVATPNNDYHARLQMASFNASDPKQRWRINPVDTSVHVTGVSLNTSELTLGVGNQTFLSANVTPGNATNKTVTWGTDDSSIATVNDGWVTARSLGSTKIWVRTNDGGKVAVCQVTVTIIARLLDNDKFTDVTDPTNSYYNAVYWAADKGITTGYSDGTFGVSKNCSRGAFVTFLWRQQGSPEPKLTAAKSGLKDFNSIGKSYQKAVLWAVEKGITTGYKDKTFRAGANVTRGAAVTFLWRAAGKPKVSITRKDVTFKDMVPAGSSFEKGILWAVENKITTGYSNNTFRPGNNCTRGATVTFLQRFDSLK